MADTPQNNQNPFSSYSPEEQADIKGQLVSLRQSGKLNPLQAQGIDRALTFLTPQQQPQAAASPLAPPGVPRPNIPVEGQGPITANIVSGLAQFPGFKEAAKNAITPSSVSGGGEFTDQIAEQQKLKQQAIDAGVLKYTPSEQTGNWLTRYKRTGTYELDPKYNTPEMRQRLGLDPEPTKPLVQQAGEISDMATGMLTGIQPVSTAEDIGAHMDTTGTRGTTGTVVSQLGQAAVMMRNAHNAEKLTPWQEELQRTAGSWQTPKFTPVDKTNSLAPKETPSATEPPPIEQKPTVDTKVAAVAQPKVVPQAVAELPKVTAEQLRKQFADLPNVGADKADAAMSLLEANAKYLGKDLESYVNDHFAGVVQGGRPSPEALYQSGDPMWGLKSEDLIRTSNRFSDTKPMDVRMVANELYKGGVSKAELKWLDLEDLLKQGTVTKQELLDHIDNNRVTLKDVWKGSDLLDPAIAKIRADYAQSKVEWDNREKADGRAVEEAAKRLVERDNTFNSTEAFNSVHDWLDGVAEPTVDRSIRAAFSKEEIEQLQTTRQQYLDAMQNSRFIADKLRTMDLGNDDNVQPRYKNYSLPNAQNYKELILQLRGKHLYDADNPEALNKEHYASNHWEEPNPVVHARLSDRMGANGKKYLHIEEMQSDWAQDAREQGVLGKDHEAKFQTWISEMEHLENTYGFNRQIEITPDGRERPTSAEAHPEEYRRYLQLQREVPSAAGVPPMPWLETPDNYKLAMKRLIRHAAENGYDGVSWSPGDVHRNRWGTDIFSIAKDRNGHLMEMRRTGYDSNSAMGDGGPGLRDLGPVVERIKDYHQQQLEFYAKNPSVYDQTLDGEKSRIGVRKHLMDNAAWKEDGSYSKTTPKTPEQVREQFASIAHDPQVAEKLAKTWEKLQPGEVAHVDTRTEGFRGAYDKILPDVTNKLVKKFGGSVGKTDVKIQEPYLKTPKGNEILATPENLERYGNKTISDSGYLKVHSVDITPEMRESVKSTKDYLFQNRKKGTVEFLKDGRALIHAFDAADVSTLAHESAHVFRRIMKPEERAVAEKWLGVQNGKWDVPHEEAFARGFEKYLREGKAPTTGLAKVFENFKTWLTDIYKRTVRNSPTLTPDARRLYDRLLGSSEGYPSLADKMRPVEAWDAKNRPRIEQLSKEISDHQSELKRGDQKRWNVVNGERVLKPILADAQKEFVRKEIARKQGELDMLRDQRATLQGKLTREALKEANPAKPGPKDTRVAADKTPLMPSKVAEAAIKATSGGSTAEGKTSLEEAARLNKEAQEIVNTPDAPKVEPVVKSSAEKAPSQEPKVADPLVLVNKAIANIRAGKKISATAVAALSDLTGRAFTDEHLADGQKKLAHDLANWATAETNRRYLEARGVKKTTESIPETPKTAKKGKAKEPVQNSQTPGEAEATTTPSRALNSLSPAGIKMFGQLREVREALLKSDPDVAKNFSLIEKAAQEGIDAKSEFSRESEWSRQLKALQYVKDHPEDAFRLKAAIDIARRKGEQGFVGNRQPYTDAELDAIAKSHAETVLARFEAQSEPELALQNAFHKLRAPMFERAINDAGDPALSRRYQDLLTRTAGLKPEDPVVALSRNVGGETFTPGDLARMTLRERLGELKQRKAQMFHELDAELKTWDKKSIQETMRFVEEMETGRYSSDPTTAALQGKLRNILDTRRDNIYGLGKGFFEKYLEHYFPHLWEDPKGVSKHFTGILNSRRPFEGGRGFLKPRDYEFFLDGVQSGLRPVTWNPVRMALMRAYEMDRFYMANHLAETWKTIGLAKYLKMGEDVPTGYDKLDQNVFTPRVRTADGAIQQFGQYWAPKDAAKVINNYLSPGLKGYTAYDFVQGYNNLINQVNLGLSAFHGFEIMYDSFVGDGALAGAKLLRAGVRALQGRGQEAFKEFKSAVVDPTAIGSLGPLPRAATFAMSGIENYAKGSKMLAEYLSPGTHANLHQLVDNVATAGGVVEQDPVYRNQAVESWRKAWKEAAYAEGFDKAGPIARGVYHSVGAAMEKMGSPLMSNFVPRAKLGAFMKLAQDIAERHATSPDEVITRALDQAWDSVDNRMGEVVYDNMFMNKIAKDINHILWRSVGWNLGTFRELGGGVYDASVGTYKSLKDVRGQLANWKTIDPKMSYRTAYTLALPAMTMYFSSILMYAMTGKTPQSLTDYFYPQDANGNRIYGKSYMQDVIGWYKHPLTTASHKAAPWLSQAYEIMWANADYYGREIRQPDDNIVTQGMDVLKYLGKSSAPFSVQNAYERWRQGADLKSLNPSNPIASSFGIIPAPRWVGQTAFEQFTFDNSKRFMPQGPKTHDEASQSQDLQRMRQGLRQGTLTPRDLIAEVKSGNVSVGEARTLMKEMKTPPMESQFKHLPLAIALKGFVNYANDDERKKVLPELLKKWNSHQWDKDTPVQKTQLIDQMRKAVKLVKPSINE